MIAPKLKAPDATLLAQRRHVAIVGPTNAGKSTLFNALTGQDNAIVSPVPGTTTDPVHKAMELIPFGPIVLIDTAGLDDIGRLGGQRVEKTSVILRRADAALYVGLAAGFDHAAYARFLLEGIDHLLVLARADLAPQGALLALRRAYPHAIAYSGVPGELDALRLGLARLLEAQQPQERPLLRGLLPEDSHVLLVTPIDSAAPKGRLILPQVQVLRECLDLGFTAGVCQPQQLAQAVARSSRVDLVVTDSQAFQEVARQLPQNMPLTSFSMLLARQKGDFPAMVAAADRIGALAQGDQVLMLEGCTHNQTHEDIGRVKIPALLQQKTGKPLRFHHVSGYDFPGDLTPFSLAIQCGSCMLNHRELQRRSNKLRAAGVPLTNYGIVLAYGAGILARAAAPLLKERA